MGDRVAIAVFILMILAGVSVAASEPFSIKVESAGDTVISYVGYPLGYNLYLKSNNNASVDADIFMSLPYRSWMTSGKKTDLVISPLETVSYSLELTPPPGTSTDNYYPTISVCIKDTDSCSSTILRIHVIDRAQLSIDTLKTVLDTYEANENISVIIGLNNIGKSDITNYKFQFDLKKDGVPVGTKRISLDTIKKGDIFLKTEVLDFRYNATGVYTLYGSLIGDTGEVLGTKSVNITITDVKDSKFEKNVFITPGVFTKSITIKIQNEDNEKNNVLVKVPISGVKQIYSFDKTGAIITENKKSTFEYECVLSAKGSEGDSCTLSYRISYWKIYLLIIMFLGFVVLTYFELERPHITKKHMKKPGAHHTIHITFRNKSIGILGDVVITEFIPAVVKSAGDFSIKPSSQLRKENGTEIVWKLGNMSPKEERVITYTIIPRFEVEGGGIVLPPVEISGTNYRKKREVVKSKPLQLS